jgi:hypothetical protein
VTDTSTLRAVQSALAVPAKTFPSAEVERRTSDLKKIYSKWESLRAEALALERETIPQAREHDLETAARAALDDKPAPKSTVAAAERKLTEALAQIAVAEKAIGLGFSAYRNALLDATASLLAKLDERHDEGTKQVLAALDGLEAALATLSQIRAALGYLKAFPAGRGRYNPTSPSVPALIARHGEPYSAAEVVAALHSVTDPPSPPARVALGGINLEQLEEQAALEPELDASRRSRSANLIR